MSGGVSAWRSVSRRVSSRTNRYRVGASLFASVRLLPIVAVVLGLAGATASALAGQSGPVAGEALFVVSGRGYGHGVGMSQYGAFGMANAGYTHEEILAYYYTGTEPGRLPGRDVRVLLAEGRRAVTISSTVPYSAIDGAGTTYRFPSGPLVLRADLKVPTPAGVAAAVAPLVIRPGKNTPLSLDAHPYRGRLELTREAPFLRVVDYVGLEPYLQGVVAGEMPYRWPMEALEAQAIAARSYALANLVKGKPFDLYADQRSQVYLGVAGEQARTSDAVQATGGQVVTYAGKVASTLYFSSSGGRTASAADVFGVAAPYLVSRPDPWDKASPYHRWGPVILGARTVQAKLGLDARVLDAAGLPTPSGRLRALVLQTTDRPETVPSGLLRTALELRSTWITIGVLRLDRPRGAVVFGSSLQVSGLARRVSSPHLSESPDGSTWTPVGELAPRNGGEVSLQVKPVRTTRYRIEAGEAASPALLVRVAPRVQLMLSGEPRVLTGTVRPRLPGARVTIERQQPTGWALVAETVVDQSGAFRAELALAPGSYRARVAPASGYAEGVTQVLTVTG